MDTIAGDISLGQRRVQQKDQHCILHPAARAGLRPCWGAEPSHSQHWALSHGKIWNWSLSLTLHHHVGLGDSRKAAVEGIDFTRSQKSLREEEKARGDKDLMG